MTTIHDFTIQNGAIVIPIKELERVADNLYAELKHEYSEYTAGQSCFVEKLLHGIYYPNLESRK